MKIKHLIMQNYKYDAIYQRNSDAWSLKLQKNLIDSILNNYYIPEILIANNEILDGKQRISTIIKFMDNKFEILIDGMKIKYESLNEFQKSKIDNYDIHVKDLGNMDSNKILTTFLRINEGSVKLSKAELLMAKATNYIRDSIRELCENKKIISISNNKKKDKRFSIEEIIVRIFSIIDIQKTKQNGSVRTHMEDIVKNNCMTKDDIEKFKETLDILYKVVGNDTIKNKSFNTLFESIFIAFFNQIKNKNSFIYNSEKLKKEIYQVQNDINQIQMGGGNKFDDFKYVKNRIRMVESILEKYFKDQKRIFTYDEKLEIWNKNKHICVICNKTLKTINDYEPDHIVSHTKGGKTNIENCQILCRTCNRKKSSN